MVILMVFQSGKKTSGAYTRLTRINWDKSWLIEHVYANLVTKIDDLRAFECSQFSVKCAGSTSRAPVHSLAIPSQSIILDDRHTRARYG